MKYRYHPHNKTLKYSVCQDYYEPGGIYRSDKFVEIRQWLRKHIGKFNLDWKISEYYFWSHDHYKVLYKNFNSTPLWGISITFSSEKQALLFIIAHGDKL